MARTDRTNKKRAEFLDALAETASVVRACKMSGVPRRTAYDWRRDDEEFAAEWERALDVGTDALEDEATRRAFEGVDEPVHYQGEATSTIRKYSDTLLMFMLKARRPDKFKDRAAHEHSGAGGKDLIPPTIKIVRDDG